MLEKGYTHQQAADSLGVSLSALGRWVRAERPRSAVSGVKPQAMNLADHNELVRLRKENEQLRMEREIIIPTGHKKRPQSFMPQRVSLRKNSGELRIHLCPVGIQGQQKTYPVTVLCKVMAVSTSAS